MRHKQDTVRVKTGTLGSKIAEIKNIEGLKGEIEETFKKITELDNSGDK